MTSPKPSGANLFEKFYVESSILPSMHRALDEERKQVADEQERMMQSVLRSIGPRGSAASYIKAMEEMIRLIRARIGKEK